MGLRMKEMADNCLIIQTCIILHNFALAKDDPIELEQFLEIQAEILARLQREASEEQNDSIEIDDRAVLSAGKRFRQYVVDTHFTH